MLHLPWFATSLLLMALVGYALLPSLGWVVVLGWLATGALAFHRPTESAFARHLLDLRHPTPRERARLEPVWREVTARAGVDGRAYELWIQDRDDVNALAAAGHIVSVTRSSLAYLPSHHLAAVLAHELGHHIGGHAWSSLLGLWYSAPGRSVWAAVRWLTRQGLHIARRLNDCAALLLGLAAGGVLVALALSYWFVLLALVVAPYPMAALARQAELRADRFAAGLGFGPVLAEVLHTMERREADVVGHHVVAACFGCGGAASAAGAAGRARTGRPALMARLLTSHPDYHTRLHHLAPYLAGQR
ncbi:M48 family metalloprotease [Streptomyces lydicus]|uniref:M48 family metalloprotease n=1 Tax=Streptomyces lydicus TaxID=47763 RepID=UPI0037A70A0B